MLFLQLKQHLDGDCPMSKANCPYETFGCTFVVSIGHVCPLCSSKIGTPLLLSGDIPVSCGGVAQLYHCEA